MCTIEQYQNITRIINIPLDELNLDKTLNCGQAFRWEKRGSKWYGVIGNNIVILHQGVFKDGKSGIATNLPLEKASILIKYLNLDVNYTQEVSNLNLNLDEFAVKAYEFGKGIHILKQDLFEMMVTFLMSQCNTMHNIRNIINKLCEKYGEKLELEWYGEHIINYAFPTPKQLLNATENELTQCSMGFRAKYLIQMLQVICVDNPDILKILHQCDYKQAMNILTVFNGIGDKVANCICLFGLHHIQAFPIDTHIRQIINEYYNGELDISKYGNIAGIIQQYIFYYKAFY